MQRVERPTQYVENAMQMLRETFPDGILGYYHHDGSVAHAVCGILREKLATILVLPVSTSDCGGNTKFAKVTPGLWPADIGSQVGNRFYGIPSLLECVLYPALDASHAPPPDFNFTEEIATVQKYFPKTDPSITADHPLALEGGCMVPILGSNEVVYVPQIHRDYEDLEYLFEDEGFRVLNCPIAQDWRPTLYQAMSRLAIDFSRDWTFTNRHIDVLLTGAHNSRTNKSEFFIDSMLWEYLHEQESILGNLWVPRWLEGAIPVAHDCVARGALNIGYVTSSEGSIAVCADETILHPKLRELYNQENITVLALGADQVAYKGGPKCRMLRLMWPD